MGSLVDPILQPDVLRDGRTIRRNYKKMNLLNIFTIGFLTLEATNVLALYFSPETNASTFFLSEFWPEKHYNFHPTCFNTAPLSVVIPNSPLKKYMQIKGTPDYLTENSLLKIKLQTVS